MYRTICITCAGNEQCQKPDAAIPRQVDAVVMPVMSSICFKESYGAVDYVNENTCQHYQKEDSQDDCPFSIALF